MTEMRIALPEDTEGQKLLWKLGFGDGGGYIDAHFRTSYKPEHAAVLLSDGEMASRTEMLPAELVLPDGEAVKSDYIYALTTHPGHRGHGYAVMLTGFALERGAERGSACSVIVPAEEGLFIMYGRTLSYFDAFYIREAVVGKDRIKPASGGNIIPASVESYNEARGNALRGWLHVRYGADCMGYQKSLSQESGADIYLIDAGGGRGCAAAERYSAETVIIKELLMPEEALLEGLALVAGALPAEKYIVRTPAFSGEALGGSVRRFGMMKWTGARSGESALPGEQGYMGIAFD